MNYTRFWHLKGIINHTCLALLGASSLAFRTFTISGRGFFNVGIYVPWYICVCIYIWWLTGMYVGYTPWNLPLEIGLPGYVQTRARPLGVGIHVNAMTSKTSPIATLKKIEGLKNNHQFRLGFAKFNLLLGKAQFNGRFFSDFPTKARSFVASEIFSLVLSNNGGCKTWEIEALNHGMFGFSRHVQTDQSHCHNQDLHGTFDVAVIGYPLWRRPRDSAAGLTAGCCWLDGSDSFYHLSPDTYTD